VTFFDTAEVYGPLICEQIVQNLRRGPYELGVDAPPATRVAAAFTELAQAI
jgi:hypothetical protein